LKVFGSKKTKGFTHDRQDQPRLSMSEGEES